MGQGIGLSAKGRAALARLTPEGVEKGVRAGMKRLAPFLLGQVKKTTPAKTGFLRRAWSVRLLDAAILLLNPANYARLVEKGTKPHLIFPKNKQALAWRKGGKGPISAYRVGPAGARSNFIFAAKVKHPGTKPQPMVKPALKNSSQVVREWMSQALTDQLKGK